MPSTTKTTVIIVSKTGSLSECQVETNKETTIEELTVLLSKKCGYRNHDGFSCYHTWRYKNKNKNKNNNNNNSQPPTDNNGVSSKYIYIDIWGKTDGRAGNENKYEIPPPIDELMFFGNIALVARVDKENAMNLTIELWEKIYEKLFGGFEDLTTTALDDDNESDELASIPASMKTHNGYLKDGFIVDDDSEDTPRAKPKNKTSKLKSGSGGSARKNKSESTESEFITETETDSETLPSSDSPTGSDADADVDVDVDADVDADIPKRSVNNTKSKRSADNSNSVTANKPKRTIKKQPSVIKSKKQVVEDNVQEEIESELSEDSYD